MQSVCLWLESALAAVESPALGSHREDCSLWFRENYLSTYPHKMPIQVEGKYSKRAAHETAMIGCAWLFFELSSNLKILYCSIHVVANQMHYNCAKYKSNLSSQETGSAPRMAVC